MINLLNMEDRDKLVERIFEDLKKDSNPTKFIYYFKGPQGSGRRYIIGSLIEKIDLCQNVDNFNLRIYNLIGETFVEHNKSTKRYVLSGGLNVSHFVGVNLSIVKNDNSKLLIILNSLKKFPSKDILICIDNYDDLSSESKDYITTIINNYDYFIQQLGVKIFMIIVTDNHENTIQNNCETVNFAHYSEEDVKNYITKKFPSIINNGLLNEEKLKSVTTLCQGDFSTLNLIAEEVIKANSYAPLDELITKIVDKILKSVQKSGKEAYNLMPGTLKDFLITCALSVESFNKKLLAEVCELSHKEISESFSVSSEQKILETAHDSKYYFKNQKVKSNLAQRLTDTSKFIDYYNYYTDNLNDEYLLRAYYLYQAIGNSDYYVYNLLILAVSRAMISNDETIIDKISKFFPKLSESEMNQLLCFKEIYKCYNNSQFVELGKKINEINRFLLNKLGKAELHRIAFKATYSNKECEINRIMPHLEALILIAKNESDLYLRNIHEKMNVSGEPILRLRIIFDIAPYVLDNLNDVGLFEELFDSSRVICKNEKAANRPFAEYIKNVFNRKAFLFVNSAQANFYYEEAEVYFFNKGYFSEYIMTLAGKAGILMAQSRYEEAVETCKEAKKFIKENDVKIPYSYRLDNNYYIATFLDFENRNAGNIDILAEEAKKTLSLLKDLDRNTQSHAVVLLNIASLALYSDSFEEYERAKELIQKKLDCKDVADVNDVSVDDFYRYRFAWFEIYKNLQIKEFSKCFKILDSLKNFIPALSHKHDVLWDDKINAAMSLVSECEAGRKITAYDFCNKLYDDKRPSACNLKFDYRGLPVSALQYTSVD